MKTVNVEKHGSLGQCARFESYGTAYKKLNDIIATHDLMRSVWYDLTYVPEMAQI